MVRETRAISTEKLVKLITCFSCLIIPDSEGNYNAKAATIVLNLRIREFQLYFHPSSLFDFDNRFHKICFIGYCFLICGVDIV